MTTTAPQDAPSREAIDAALDRAKLDPMTALTPEQEQRAASAPKGLRGKALALFITEGKTGAEQAKEAKAQREAQAAKTTASKRASAGKAGAKARANGREGLTTVDAIEKVLKDARQPLTPKEITARIQKRGLAPGLKGKTPDATVGARLAVGAKKGERFKRVSPGVFDLIDR